MELWIRSQNKKRLVKAEHIYYCEDDFTNNELKHYICITGAYDLGVYSTKERALEVLDEIQKMLQPQTIINYENKLEFHPEYTVQNVVKTIPKTEITELSTYVYQMPED